MTAVKLLALLLLFVTPVHAEEEVLYRMSKTTRDRWLQEGLSWYNFIGARPPAGVDPEDWLFERITWGRLKTLKAAGITREVVK